MSHMFARAGVRASRNAREQVVCLTYVNNICLPDIRHASRQRVGERERGVLFVCPTLLHMRLLLLLLRTLYYSLARAAVFQRTLHVCISSCACVFCVCVMCVLFVARATSTHIPTENL